MITDSGKTKKLTILLGVTVLVLATVGFFSLRWYVDLQHFVSTDDARVAANNYHIAAKIGGKIKAIYVKEGDFVTQNACLSVIDPKDFEIALLTARYNLDIAKNRLAVLTKGARSEDIAIAKAKVDQAKIQQDSAEDDFGTAKNLFSGQMISTRDYQKAENARDLAKKNYTSATEYYNLTKNGARDEDKMIAAKQVDQAELALTQSKTNLSNTRVLAPVSGTIALKTVNLGEMVSQGQSFFVLINPNESWIEANIKETDIARIKIGAAVSIFLDAYPGKIFQGKVFEIGVATNSNFSILPVGNAGGNFVKVVQLIPIKIRVLNNHFPLQVGTSARIKVQTGS